MLCFGEKPRSFHCKIVFLDETELIQEIQNSTIGQDLLEVAFKHLNLVETAYFGLRYVDANNQTHWLDTAKKIAKQLKGTDPFTLYFGVKFYVSDPCKLLEEITRYQFFLQVKQDVLQGRLPVAFDLCAELCAYIVQSELGDYDHRRHQPNYVSDFQFVTNQNNELESRAMELHKSLVGQVPAVAELNYLEKVKWLDMYGVDLHPVLGEDNVEYFIGLTPSGVIVLRNKTKVGNYFWPRISKVYFKGKYFMLRVRDKNNEDSTYGFELPSKQACKHLWKCCVEHHAFFRLTQVNSQNPGKVFTLNSRFRYSGRTERQIQEELEQSSCNRSPPQVTRVPSRRYQRRLGQPDGIDSSVKDMENKENERFETRSNISGLRFVQVPASNMSRASSVPVIRQRSGSPQSDRSAPWEYPKNGRGLFSSSTNPSPRSVRSAGYKPHVSHNNRYSNRRSSSVDSEDSGGSRRRRHHRSRQGSDNDSELSRSSKHSHSRSRRHRSGSGRHREDSGDRDSHNGRHRHRSRRQKSSSNYELVDSESQWKEVQMAQREKHVQTAQNAVVRDLSRRSGYVNSGMESESEASFHQSRKNRRHKSRSRSQSPSESRTKPPEELRKHFDYNLIDTTGLSSEQLQNISYTKVETEAKPYRVKCSPNSKHRSRGSHARGVSYEQKHHGTRRNDGEYGPPPPYTPNPQASVNGKPNHTSSPASSTRSHMHQQTMNGHNGHLVPSLPRHQQTSMQAKILVQTQNIHTRRMVENGSSYSHHENSDSGLGTEGQDYSPNSRSLSRIPGQHRAGPKPPYFASIPSQNHAAVPKPVSMNLARTLPASYSSCSPSPSSSSPSPRMPSIAVPIPGGYGNNNNPRKDLLAPRQSQPQTACDGNTKPRTNASPSSFNVYSGNTDRVNGLDLRPQPNPTNNHHPAGTYRNTPRPAGYPIYPSNGNGMGAGGQFANGLGSEVVSSIAPCVHPSQTNSNGLQSGLLPFPNGVSPSAYPYPNQGQQLPARTPVQMTSPHMSAYHHATMVQNFHWVANGNPAGKAVPVYPGTNGVANNPEQHTRSENHEMSTEL